MHEKRSTCGTRAAVLGLATTLIGSLPHATRAQTIYVAGSGNEFGTLDLSTGKLTKTGTLASTLDGMGFTSDGSLYGVDTGSQLYQVSAVTGSESAMGPVSEFPFTATSSGGLLFALSADPSADFFSINPADQSVTDIASGTGILSDGMLAAEGATLYAAGADADGVSTLFRLTTGGGVTEVGATGAAGLFFSGVFAGGTLYGFNSDGGIYTFDTGTGAARQVGTYDLGTAGDTVFAAAATPAAAPPAAAPEPSEAIALGLGVLGVTSLALRARRRGREGNAFLG